MVNLSAINFEKLPEKQKKEKEAKKEAEGRKQLFAVKNT